MPGVHLGLAIVEERHDQVSTGLRRADQWQRALRRLPVLELPPAPPGVHTSITHRRPRSPNAAPSPKDRLGASTAGERKGGRK